MARLAVTIALIFSLFLLSHARIQPNDPEDQNQLVEWKPSISNDLPDSTSDTNDLIDFETDPKILLPTQKPLEDDVVVSQGISESESTGNAEELPESETTISSIDDEDLEDDKQHEKHEKHEKHKKHKKHGFFYHLFHKHCHHHHHHPKNGTKHEKRGFFFHFFHKHCHKHHHHHHKNDTKDEGMEKVTEKQFELRNAGEEIPDEDHMIKRFKPRKGGFLHGKRVHPRYSQVGDGEGKIKFEEGTSKHHHKEWKKEKKHRGLIRWFKKFFKHF